MLDIGWQELLVIGVLALLVVGPKELPGLLRTVGQWAGRARSVAREFQRSMEDAAREADLDELKELGNVKRDVEKMGRVGFDEQAKRVQSSLTNPKLKDRGIKAGPGVEAETPAAPGAEESAAGAPAPSEGGGSAPSAAPAPSVSGGGGAAPGGEAETAAPAETPARAAGQGGS